MGRLDGKVAIVTGAGMGLGASIMALFAREGAKVVGTARREGNVQNVIDELKKEADYDLIAWIGCIIDWVIDRPKISTKEYARLMYANNTISNEPILLSDVNIE